MERRIIRRLILVGSFTLLSVLTIAAASTGAPVVAATPPLPSVVPLVTSGGHSSTRPAPTAVLTPDIPAPARPQEAAPVVSPTPTAVLVAPTATATAEVLPTDVPTPAVALPVASLAPECIDASQLVPLLDESDVQAVDQATGLPMWLLPDDSGTVVLGNACPMPTPQPPPAVPVQVP